jgi:hypothetical protein
MKVSTEIDNNFGYEKITQLVDNIPLSMVYGTHFFFRDKCLCYSPSIGHNRDFFTFPNTFDRWLYDYVRGWTSIRIWMSIWVLWKMMKISCCDYAITFTTQDTTLEKNYRKYVSSIWRYVTYRSNNIYRIARRNYKLVAFYSGQSIFYTPF